MADTATIVSDAPEAAIAGGPADAPEMPTVEWDYGPFAPEPDANAEPVLSDTPPDEPAETPLPDEESDALVDDESDDSATEEEPKLSRAEKLRQKIREEVLAEMEAAKAEEQTKAELARQAEEERQRQEKIVQDFAQWMGTPEQIADAERLADEEDGYGGLTDAAREAKAKLRQWKQNSQMFPMVERLVLGNMASMLEAVESSIEGYDPTAARSLKLDGRLKAMIQAAQAPLQAKYDRLRKEYDGIKARAAASSPGVEAPSGTGGTGRTYAQYIRALNSGNPDALDGWTQADIDRVTQAEMAKRATQRIA